MVELLEGNVLLKPAQKRRILSHLRRCSRLSDSLGNSRLAVTIDRVGNRVEARAVVKNKVGHLECRAKNDCWESAITHLIRHLHDKVHAQRVRASAA